MSIFRACTWITSITSVRALCGAQRALVGRNIQTRTLTSTIEPCADPTHWHRNNSSQGATRPGPFATAADTTVPSDQLGFIPDQHPTVNLPIANADDRKIAILWTPQNWSRFHHIWLRDHCRCPSCFHPVTKQRLVNTFEIPRDIKPHHVQASAEGLEVIWPTLGAECHASFYPWSWLKAHTYDPPPKPSSTFGEKTLWGTKIAKSPPTVSYADAMDGNDQGLYKWLSNIDRFGFCLVVGVPATPEATEELSKRIGFIRETQYGKLWEFTADHSRGDTAYTTIALGAHTDNTYFTDPCGLQLFHLLSHTGGSGGATLLADGFYIASLLKELYPDAYELLSRIPVPAHAAGEVSALYQPSPPNGYPALRHDASGGLVQVRWNNDDRSVMDHLDAELVEPWYDAIRAWHMLLTSADSEYWVQLTPGTVLSVDNHRVLHGRSAFDGKRRVCGAYIGVDEYRSRLGVLRARMSDGGHRSVWSRGL